MQNFLFDTHSASASPFQRRNACSPGAYILISLFILTVRILLSLSLSVCASNVIFNIFWASLLMQFLYVCHMLPPGYSPLPYISWHFIFSGLFLYKVITEHCRVIQIIYIYIYSIYWWQIEEKNDTSVFVRHQNSLSALWYRFSKFLERSSNDIPSFGVF